MKHLGVIGEIYEQLAPFFSSRHLEWNIMLTGERWPQIVLRVRTQRTGSRDQIYAWKAAINVFSLEQAIAEGYKKVFIDRFIEQVKRSVGSGPSGD